MHYRQDAHDEHNDNRPTNKTARNTEPVQHQSQHSLSLALEDTFHATPDLDLTAGVSYDSYAIGASEEFGAGAIFSYPKGEAEAFN